MTKKPTKKQLEAELAERRRVGGLMANVCFNLAQMDRLDKGIRESLDRLRKEWDQIDEAVRRR